MSEIHATKIYQTMYACLFLFNWQVDRKGKKDCTSVQPREGEGIYLSGVMDLYAPPPGGKN
jgi:hypothetical protein